MVTYLRVYVLVASFLQKLVHCTCTIPEYSWTGFPPEVLLFLVLYTADLL